MMQRCLNGLRRLLEYKFAPPIVALGPWALGIIIALITPDDVLSRSILLRDYAEWFTDIFPYMNRAAARSVFPEVTLFFHAVMWTIAPVWLGLWLLIKPDMRLYEKQKKHRLSLASLGISELNYSMGTFTRNGQIKQLASPDLEADRDGTRINVVPEGILVQNRGSDQISLLVTRIDDLTAVEANRDGVTSFEDVETIIGGADLLANDTLGGFTGRDLSITGLSNFRHGTGFIDANGFVHFNPEANYAGAGAGFDYSVLASNGQTGMAANDGKWRVAA